MNLSCSYCNSRLLSTSSPYSFGFKIDGEFGIFWLNLFSVSIFKVQKKISKSEKNWFGNFEKLSLCGRQKVARLVLDVFHGWILLMNLVLLVISVISPLLNHRTNFSQSAQSKGYRPVACIKSETVPIWAWTIPQMTGNYILGNNIWWQKLKKNCQFWSKFHYGNWFVSFFGLV